MPSGPSCSGVWRTFFIVLPLFTSPALFRMRHGKAPRMPQGIRKVKSLIFRGLCYTAKRAFVPFRNEKTRWKWTPVYKRHIRQAGRVPRLLPVSGDFFSGYEAAGRRPIIQD